MIATEEGKGGVAPSAGDERSGCATLHLQPQGSSPPRLGSRHAGLALCWVVASSTHARRQLLPTCNLTYSFLIHMFTVLVNHHIRRRYRVRAQFPRKLKVSTTDGGSVVSTAVAGSQDDGGVYRTVSLSLIMQTSHQDDNCLHLLVVLIPTTTAGETHMIYGGEDSC